MKFYDCLTNGKIPQPTNGVSEEDAIAAFLINTQFEMDQRKLRTQATNFNTLNNYNVDVQKIIDMYELIQRFIQGSLRCQDAIAYFCKDNGIKVNFRNVDINTTSSFFIQGEKKYDMNYIEQLLIVENGRGRNIFSALKLANIKFSPNEIRAALTIYHKNCKREYINTIYQNIKYDNSAIFDEDKVSNMMGWTQEDFKVIKYTIWGIKRRMHFGEYTRRICPYLYSTTQGLGKTELARAMLKPLGELVAVMTGAEYLDMTNHTTQELYAAIVDDIDTSERKDIGSIKGQLSFDEKMSRVLFSNASKNIIVNVWPWFTSNKKVSHVFLDSTGNTRTREITIDRKIFSFINNIDWLSLWRSIDENQDKLFNQDDWDEHTKTAQAQRTQTYLDDFLNVLLFPTDKDAICFKFNESYSPYKLFQQFEIYNKPLIATYRLNSNKLARDIVSAKFDHFDVIPEYHATNGNLIKSVKFTLNAGTSKLWVVGKN
jgi:hypothetical protein